MRVKKRVFQTDLRPDFLGRIVHKFRGFIVPDFWSADIPNSTEFVLFRKSWFLNFSMMAVSSHASLWLIRINLNNLIWFSNHTLSYLILKTIVETFKFIELFKLSFYVCRSIQRLGYIIHVFIKTDKIFLDCDVSGLFHNPSPPLVFDSVSGGFTDIKFSDSEFFETYFPTPNFPKHIFRRKNFPTTTFSDGQIFRRTNFPTDTFSKKIMHNFNI